MNTNRSYLDNLNAGRRRRRSGTSLDEISRTLEDIESRLERATQAKAKHEAGDDDISRRMERLSQHAARPSGEGARHPSLNKLARAFDDNRRREDELAFASRIAEELQALRSEVGETISSGMRRGFEALREEIAQTSPAAPPPQHGRPDRPDRRQEPEGEGRTAPPPAGDSTLEGLAQRLDEITRAVNSLPESLSLSSLENKVRTLATALEQVVEQQRLSPDLNALINERLDEISRAIAASAQSARASSFDPALLERIEARIASLAQQVEELVEEDRGEGLGNHLARLSQRVDEIAQRADLPDEAVDRLAGQIAAISEKIDTSLRPPDVEAIAHGLDDRFANLAETIRKAHGNAAEESRSLFHELEERLNALSDKLAGQEARGEADVMAALDARFAELSARLGDGRPEPADDGALRALEARLDDIAERLQEASKRMSGLDTEVIAKLESQVASLSEHLSHPGAGLPEFDDIAPRLEHIERTIAENREALFEAARRAAEEAISRLDMSQAGPAGTELAEEIRTLEALARKSDERNTKTFEAIHDTLLKIVDRLTALEAGDYEEPHENHGDDKISVESAPSIETGEAEEEPAVLEAREEEREAPAPADAKPSPAEAAAAAAEAALSGEEDNAAPASAKRSVLGGLTRALSPRRSREEESEERREPVVETADSGGEMEARDVNEPLEPGSGTPDLNAIMKRVRDERRPQTAASEAETAKSDFIAAARRAAQAAAAEAETMKKKNAESGTTSRRFGLGPLLRGRKNMLLMAVAGFVVLAGGLYAARTVFSNDMPPKVAEAPAGSAPGAAAMPTPDDNAAQGSARTADAMTETGEPEKAADAAVGSGPRPTTAPPEDNAASREGTTGTANASEGDKPGILAAGDEGDRETPADHSDAAGDQQQAIETEEVTLADIPAEAGTAALRQAAAEGNPQAMFEIGSYYADGRGGQPDKEKAAAWYRQAAERGFAPAQYRIGNMREKGIGVERDIDKAESWYERAAEQGNASAMHNLGVLYAMGADGRADNEEAARWFQKAAELGVTDSQFNLGILSAKGVGVPKDLEEAYKWFALVARDGDSDAAAKRDEIAKALDADQLENAKAKAELWKPKPLDREANFVDLPEEWTTDKTTTSGIDMDKAVTSIQIILNKNGYDAGPTDGVMGEQTRSAIRAFQKDNGMEPTGNIDKALVQALLKNR